MNLRRELDRVRRACSWESVNAVVVVSGVSASPLTRSPLFWRKARGGFVIVVVVVDDCVGIWCWLSLSTSIVSASSVLISGCAVWSPPPMSLLISPNTAACLAFSACSMQFSFWLACNLLRSMFTLSTVGRSLAVLLLSPSVAAVVVTPEKSSPS